MFFFKLLGWGSSKNPSTTTHVPEEITLILNQSPYPQDPINAILACQNHIKNQQIAKTNIKKLTPIVAQALGHYFVAYYDKAIQYNTTPAISFTDFYSNLSQLQQTIGQFFIHEPPKADPNVAIGLGVDNTERKFLERSIYGNILTTDRPTMHLGKR